MNFIFCKFRKNSNTIPLNAVVFIKKIYFVINLKQEF